MYYLKHLKEIILSYSTASLLFTRWFNYYSNYIYASNSNEISVARSHICMFIYSDMTVQ